MAGTDPHGAHKTEYEKRDITARPVVLGALAILGISALLVIPVWLIYVGLEKHEARDQAEPTSTSRPAKRPEIPGPQLEPVIGETLAATRKHENQILGGYGWVDERAGVVRIPIDRALELVAKEGLPARAGAAPYHRFSRAERGTEGSGGTSSHAVSRAQGTIDGVASGQAAEASGE